MTIDGHTVAEITLSGHSVVKIEDSNGTVLYQKGLNYLCFTAEQAGSTISLEGYGSPTFTPVLYTSTDGANWTSWDRSAITLTNIGDQVYMYGENAKLGESNARYWHFTMTGQVSASGDTTTLLTKNGTRTISSNYVFDHLFYNCTSLTTAPELPATTLSQNCYEYMFDGCTSLTTAPALPATTLTDSCYRTMFENCTSLVQAPALPATTLATRCYNSMFVNCSSLTTAPSLPATTLADYCYAYITILLPTNVQRLHKPDKHSNYFSHYTCK